MERICRECGALFTPPPVAGRPSVRCTSCRPPKPRALEPGACGHCGQTFEKLTKASRFCSQKCQRAHRRASGYVVPSRRGTCSSCGKQIQVGATSAPEPMCRPCWRASREHGTEVMYNKGRCRCDLCRAAITEAMREYVARRAAEGRPIQHTRRHETRVCDQCGAEFTCLAFKSTRYCSRTCVGLSQRFNIKRGSFSISRARRLAIYERDGWNCQICGEPTDPDADPVGGDWYPTLDHIVPQSHMLFPDHSDANLRTAHRWCNTVRGDLRCNTDADLRMVV